ncbi:MAG: 16S rRNA (adenine(1518)-N(6)/adenine(1519)-N(6))-dimethyltransferase RsmA [Chloroflexota bacterium]|nr:16S rRNA (adenine(1518)-N(6)/adenine(1519)-N(6))-dimethyltransferase RsmA [Chloroflexota bacterium]
MLLAQTKRQLRSLDLRASKGLGQHFLVDERALTTIIRALELAPADTALEVGPGLGTVTRELVKRAGRVIAIEIDPRLASALEEGLDRWPTVTVVCADVLESDPETLLGTAGLDPASPYKVAANLPYYIASAVLRRFLEAGNKPRLMVVMVQREVAELMAAAPGRMGLLSVGVQFYGRPTIVGYVPSRGFYPEPKVDSAIVRIDVRGEPAVQVPDEAQFFRVVRAGFAAPRKQLRNSLAQGLGIPPGDATGILERAGIDATRRAETLSLAEWGHVFSATKS